MTIYHTVYRFEGSRYDLKELVCIYIQKTDTDLPDGKYLDNPIILFGNYDKKYRDTYRKVPLKSDISYCLREIICDIFSEF